MKSSWFVVLGSTAAVGVVAAGGGPLDYDFAGRGDAAAVWALVRRTLGLEKGSTGPFEAVVVDRKVSCGGALCFVVEDGAQGVRVSGTSGVDAAAGVASYLRSRCNMSFAWERSGGDDVEYPPGVASSSPPAAWPRVGGTPHHHQSPPLRAVRRRAVSYGWNVCTASYSQAWWAWADWERHLDWLALSGVNLALAYTGQELVSFKTYARLFGLTWADFAAWSNGPAHLAWSRGQSMHGIGGPLPRAFAEAQWILQRRILGRMRSLGMVPVLPAFQGNVPPELAALFPSAQITVQAAHWGGGKAAWLDATDPLFARIGDAFMAQVIADFGVDLDGDGVGDATDHFYEADGYFAAGDPPWVHFSSRNEAPPPPPPPFPASLSSSSSAPRSVEPGRRDPASAFAHAAAAYGAMNRTDPEARWLYQGWIVDEGDGDIVAAYAAAVPRGRLLVSDMWAEWAPLSAMLVDRDVAFLYGVLQNFGGTLDLGMSVRVLAGLHPDPESPPGIAETFEAAGPLAAGIGAFPEGIDQNPAYFTYFFDAAWEFADDDDDEATKTTTTNSIDGLAAWWRSYVTQRYPRAVLFSDSEETEESSVSSSDLERKTDGSGIFEAWRLLAESAYGVDERGVDGFWREKARGGLLSAPGLHDPSDEPAAPPFDVGAILEAWRLLAAAPRTSLQLDYDLANVGREVLGRLVDATYYPALAAANTSSTVRAAAETLVEVLLDADALLCTSPSLRAAPVFDAAQHLLAGDLLDGDMEDDRRFLDRLARAQVTTWLPACADVDEFHRTGTCSIHADGQTPPLEDYANKAWGGLVAHYYAGRVTCYAATWPNTTACYYACVDTLARDFQLDFDRARFPICTDAPQTNGTLPLSRTLLAKYFPAS